MKAPQVSSPLLTMTEAADYLRVSRRTLYRLLDQKRFPTVLVNSRRMVKRDALDAFVERTQSKHH